MRSDEANSICLPLTPGVRKLLDDMSKDLADALTILGERGSPSTKGEFALALRVSRGTLELIYAALRSALDADDAELQRLFS